MRLAALSLVVLALASVATAQGELIVRLKRTGAARAIAIRNQVELIDQTEGAPFALYATRPGDDIHIVQSRLLTDTDVAWAEDNLRLASPESSGGGKGSTVAVIGDRNALYTQNANLMTQIGWGRSLSFRTGREIRVAVLDTGLSPSQPALWFKTIASQNFVEPTAAYDLPNRTDTNGNGRRDEGTGHGTMIAGILDQLVPKAKLVVCRVADSDGNATAWRLVEGLSFAVTHGAEIANVSLGSLNAIPALTDVMDWVEAKGMLVVAPIGNNSMKSANHPSAISKVVCVTGLNTLDRLARFSNWSGDADHAAPATGIKSTWWDGTLGTWSGTSFAAPLVVGTIANALRLGPTRTPEAIRQLLKVSGDDIDALNPGFEGQLGPKLNFRKLHRAFGILPAQ